MADEVVKVDRFSVDVPDQPGEAARILDALAGAKVNLSAFWGYPTGNGGTSRLEVVPADAAAFKAAAKTAKIKVNKEAPAFQVEGKNKAGALAGVLSKLATAGINVLAVQATSVGSKFGSLIEVAASDVRKAGKVLGS